MLKSLFSQGIKPSSDATQRIVHILRRIFKNKKAWRTAGVIIGVIALISVPFLYMYVLPDNLLVPAGFGTEVHGTASVWTPIEGSEQYDAILNGEVEKVDPDTKEALLYKGLLEAETREVITVLFDFINISEWIHLDARLRSLKATRVGSGYAMVPGTGIPGSPVNEGDIIDYTMVESYGIRGGEERVQINMKLKHVGKTEINGIEAWIWEAQGKKEPFYLHGLDMYLTYSLKLAVEPVTGYMILMNFRFDFYATPANLLDILQDERVQMTDILSKLKNRLFDVFKHRSTDEIKSMSLQNLRNLVDINLFAHLGTLAFETHGESAVEAAENAQELKNQVLFLNPGLGVILAVLGVLLLWGSLRFATKKKK